MHSHEHFDEGPSGTQAGAASAGADGAGLLGPGLAMGRATLRANMAAR